MTSVWIGAVLTALTTAVSASNGAASENVHRRTVKREAPPPPPSSAPASISATAIDAHVVLEWSDVPGATGYHIFRSSTGVWESTPLAGVAGRTHYWNGGLSSGTTYSYKVAAFNGGGDGPFSTIVTATPLAAPAGLTAAAGTMNVTLSWSASTGASGYTVYRGTSWPFASMTSVAAGVTALTFVDTGLTNGSTYYCRVLAHAGTSASRPSHAVTARPQPPPPSTPPGNLTAAAGNANVVLSWSPFSPQKLAFV